MIAKTPSEKKSDRTPSSPGLTGYDTSLKTMRYWVRVPGGAFFSSSALYPFFSHTLPPLSTHVASCRRHSGAAPCGCLYPLRLNPALAILCCLTLPLQWNVARLMWGAVCGLSSLCVCGSQQQSCSTLWRALPHSLSTHRIAILVLQHRFRNHHSFPGTYLCPPVNSAKLTNHQ
jgi:hypothetical protein